MGAPSTPADKCQARPLRMELQLQRRFRRPSGRRVRSTNLFLCHARVSLHEWHGIIDLNTRLDPLSGWILSDAADINEAGQITGQGLINGQYHAYLLTPIPFAGDYNSNGTVDAADYVLWRKNNNTAVTLPNDSTPGTSPADYTVWRSRFGQPPGSGSGVNAKTAVPEPATFLLLMFGVAGWCLRRRRAA